MNDEGGLAAMPLKPLTRPEADESGITLNLLDALHENGTIGQRALASHLGIALGLVNAYVKRCVRKGFVKVQQIPPKRYAYYLTPHGFAEKSRLTAQYLSNSLEFFRRARVDCQDVFQQCHGRGWNRVALWGVGDLCEIATLCNHPPGLVVAGIVDPQAEVPEFAGHRVVCRLADLGPVDAVMLTDLARGLEAQAEMLAELHPDRVLAPRMMMLPPPGALWTGDDEA